MALGCVDRSGHGIERLRELQAARVPTPGASSVFPAESERFFALTEDRVEEPSAELELERVA